MFIGLGLSNNCSGLDDKEYLVKSIYVSAFSRTPDRDVHRVRYTCTYPHQPVGKIKKRTATRWLQAVCTSILDVNVMLEVRHHVASFLETFFMFFQYDTLGELLRKLFA